ncbi:MAG TPA: hypothetical protein PK157_21810 [Bryobacteraceae bacterium]|nr:hypothetical protein [Bryobacteraceae bacterium]
MTQFSSVPVPAIAAGKGPFYVSPAPSDVGCCAMPHKDRAGIFSVPVDMDKAGIAIRAHEYAHLGVFRILNDKAIHRAAEKHRISERVKQVCMDCLTNAFGLTRGLEEIRDLPVSRPNDFSPWPERVLHCVQTYAIDHYRLPGDYDYVAALACSILADCGCQLAHGLVKNKKRIIKNILFAMSLIESLIALEGDNDIVRELKYISPEEIESQWGAMREVKLPFVRPITAAIRALTRRPMYVGPLMYPHRYLDGAMFGLRRRVVGGTLLIDMSGSMNITSNQIDAILACRPAATIAAYGSEIFHCRSGMLVIVARNGRAVDTEVLRNTIGFGNVVDGPALQWLCEQPEPRIWISDGHVTGVGDRMSPILIREAMELAKREKITRFSSVDEFLKKESL